MGGGDLNLKKSWHPSTMKNMEKVWKAEQQNDREKKKIAELKKEIEMEKDREDMTKYAMDHGVIEKKKEKKLDWMYKGPNQMVNREDYLLGKPVDKAFEQMVQAEKEADLNRVPKNHVEHECIPPSLRFFSGDEQVDLARKMQEDPLYAIKKKEIETRNQLLKNPVKLKQLKGLLEQQSGKKEKKKKKKQLAEESSDDDDDEIKLDMLLAAKYKQLKDNISKKDLLKSMKKLKHKQKKKTKKHHKSESESDSSDDDTSPERKHRKRNRKRDIAGRSISDNNSESSVEREKRNSKNEYYEKHKNRKHTRESKDRNSDYERNKRYKAEYDGKSKRLQYEENKQRNEWRSRYKNEKRHYEEKRRDETFNARHATFDTKSSNTGYMKFKEEKKGEEKWRSKIKPRLTEEEKEQRRQEMMANALWRDKEREQNVKQYREEEKREVQNSKSYNQDFIRKQLIDAAKVGTVASRIKANINNIQRSGRAMDTNFAKR